MRTNMCVCGQRDQDYHTLHTYMCVCGERAMERGREGGREGPEGFWCETREPPHIVDSPVGSTLAMPVWGMGRGWWMIPMKFIDWKISTSLDHPQSLLKEIVFWVFNSMVYMRTATYLTGKWWQIKPLA